MAPFLPAPKPWSLPGPAEFVSSFIHGKPSGCGNGRLRNRVHHQTWWQERPGRAGRQVAVSCRPRLVFTSPALDSNRWLTEEALARNGKESVWPVKWSLRPGIAGSRSPPTANAETASLKSAERERARRWFATDWQVKEGAKAGARAARRWQRKEKCARGQTVAGDSRECVEPSNPARKRVRPRTAERDRARTGLHGRLGIRAVDLSTKPQTGNENTTPGDGLPEARPFRDRTKNSRGVPRAS